MADSSKRKIRAGRDERPPESPTWTERVKVGVTRHSWEIAAYSALGLVALVMRLWDLGFRAMHHDESLHAFYAWNLSSGQGYQHNPMMHGPFQIEASAAVFRMFGDGDFTARIPYVFAGTVLVLLPLLLRRRLGRTGALIVSAMLAFSPTMLYFSRFARNDIIMAVWTLGLVGCMWRYLDDGKNRYLYIAAALLALSFATKETAYLVTATLGLYLSLTLVSEALPRFRGTIVPGQVSPPVAIYRLVSALVSAVASIPRAARGSRPLDFLALMIALTLPVWAAFVSVLQDTPVLSWSNLVLASAVGEGGPIGAPLRGGVALAAYIVVVLMLAGVYLGFRWRWSVWWRAAIIFYGTFVALYTTFWTNPQGLGSGVWQSLGYWVVQQGEARGGQPWYYYFVIGSVYEFIPLIFGVAAMVYYLRRRDRFAHFLVFWAVTTFVLYTVASEKMPWLLVNVVLPLIVLSGLFISEMIRLTRWRRVVTAGGLALLPGVPLLVVLLYAVAFFSVDEWQVADAALLISMLIGLAAVVTGAFFLAKRTGYRNFAAVSALSFFGLLIVLTLRTGWNAAYRNGDVPVEMIVYTQTTPDIARLVRYVEGRDQGSPGSVPVTVDGTGGFHWPWRWYLRDSERAGYVSYDGSAPAVPPSASVLLVHSQNQSEVDPVLLEQYVEGRRIKHRWWFPENYRGLTLGKLLGGLVDRGAWRNVKDYFLHRKLSAQLGSEDAYVYFARDFDADFEPSR